MSDLRHCASGNHFTLVSSFRVFKSSGRVARDCRTCTAARIARVNARPDPVREGVDIDAIHFKLGRVSPALLARRKSGQS